MIIPNTKYQVAITLFSIFYFLFSASVAQAAAGVPKILNHQGRLFDSNANLLGGAGTNFCFRFSIFDNATVGLGTKLWPSGTPAIMTINVKNGVFNVGIGDTSAGGDTLDVNFQDNDTIFLNVEVAAQSAGSCAGVTFENLSPRQRIFSSGYAINSDTVDGFHAAQSGSGNQIPVLTSGNLILGGINPQLTASSTNALVLQGGASGDLQFFSSANRITSAGALTLAGGITAGTSTLTNLTVTNLATSSFAGPLIIGSGTPTSTIKLKIVGGGLGLDNGQRIAWRNSVNSADTFVIDMSGDTAFLRGGGGTPTLRFDTVTGLTIMTLLESGKVGVATSTPSQLLSVAGNGYLTGGLGVGQVETGLGNITASGKLTILSVNATSTLASGGLTVGGDQFVIQQGSGNIGIGTSTPSEKIHLTNGSFLQDTPTNPKLIGGQNLVLPGGGLQLNYVSGRYVYMIFNNAVGTDILRIVDVTDPTAPAVVGGASLSLPGSPRSIYVAGRYAYLTFRNATSTDIFRIVDISNPANPSVVGGAGLSLPANGQHVFVSGRYAYLTFDNGTGTNTFRIIDVANPANPTIVGGSSLSLPSSPRQVYISGHYAYVVFYSTVNTDALRIIDVTDPANPAVVGGGALVLGFSTWSIFVSGRYAYIGFDNTTGGQIFRVVDISNPASPSIVGGSGLDSILPGFAKSVFISGRYAYAAFDNAAGSNSFRIIDVSKPANPTVVGGVSLSLPGFPKSVFINGHYAYLVFFQGAGTDTFRIVDISGLEAVSALLHSLEAGSLQVTTNAQIQNQLAVGGGLNIDGGGLFVSGGVGIGGETLLTPPVNSRNALTIRNQAGGQANFVLFKDSLGLDQFRVTASGTALANGFIAKQMQFSEEFVRVHANVVADTAGGGTTGLGDTFAWGAGELGTCTWSTVANALNGIQRQATGATGSGCLTYLSAAVGIRQDILKAANNPTLVFKLRPSVIGANNWVLAGLMDYTGGSVGLPANGVYFSSEGGSEWAGVARIGNVQTRVSCPGQTILTNQDAYLEFVVASSSVEFFVDNNVSDGIAPISCGITSTTTPSINLTAEMMDQARTGGTAAMNLDVDYVRINQDDPSTPEENATSAAPSITSRADVAEEIPALEAANLEAGDLVALVRGRRTMVAKSSTPYEPTLYGVVSTDPGLILGEGFDDSVRVALVGRAPVKINLENGPIEVGDWLTSSGEPGVAMKSIRPGMVIGRALEPYTGSSSSTVIMAAIEPQDWRGSENASLTAATSENYVADLLNQILEKLTAAVVQVKKLVSEAIETISLKARYLEIGSAAEPGGITIYDQVTKEPRCLTIENGNIRNILGSCVSAAAATSSYAASP